MSRIDDLIAEHCPNGASYRSLTDVAEYVRGITYNKGNEQADGPVSVLRANNISLASNTLNFFDVKRVSGSVRVRDNQRLVSGDILICAGSGSKDHIGKVAFVFEDLEHTFGGFMGVVRTKGELEPRFLFHLLTGGSFLAYLGSALSTTTINNLNTGVMRGFRVPVPPLEVQREIVRILDTFSALEAELEAELEARKQQYEHYRAVLVDSSQTGERVSLGEIEDRGFVKLGRGKVISKVVLAEIPGNYPVYSSSGAGTGEFGRYGEYMFDDERITWSVDGGGRFFYRHPHRFSVTNVSGWMTVDTSVFNVKYLYYVLTTQWENQSFDYTRKAHPSVIRDVYSLAIPSLTEQEEIVQALDKFDALVNDLSVGLPAELAARRQQYEYYRDRLLSFKELEVAA